MANKKQPTPIAAPTPSENRQPLTSKATSEPKVKKGKTKKGQKVSPSLETEARSDQGFLIDFEVGISKTLQPPATPKIPKNAKIPQNPIKNAKVSQAPIKKGKGIDIPETLKQASSNSVASASNNEATAGSSPASTAGPSDPTLLSNQKQKTETNSTTNIAPKISDFKHDEVFRLAAATPVPISPIIERQFHESQLLLYALEKVRGEHRKRQSYYGELDQDETELRRSFVDKLAYICDFKKGGSTVTAIALQKTNQGVKFWISANETIKPKVIKFLQQILQVLKNVDSVSRQTTEAQLLALIVPFNEERLDYYWTALKRTLPSCMERLDDIESNADAIPSLKQLAALKKLLSGLPRLSKTRADLVRECFEARRNRSVFETLAQLSASGNAHCKFFDDIRHLLGRLGEHMKAAKTIVLAALRFPAVLDEFEIKARASPPARCYFQSSHTITLDGLAGRIFKKDDEVTHYQEALETLERTSNSTLLSRLHQECLFKTRVHAELILADYFYWQKFEFVEDDRYIGCSKPACFNCFHYLLAHPENFVLPACHNKLYLTWRTPDIVEDKELVSAASKIREGITSKMNSNIRAELKRQIDGRYAKRPPQYDSVTGTSSSINVGHILQPLANISDDEEGYITAQEYLPSRTHSPSEYLSRGTPEIDSDDDLSWYMSRVKNIKTALTVLRTDSVSEPDVN